MRSASSSVALAGEREAQVPEAFLVLLQDETSRAYRRIGRLSRDPQGEFEFRYDPQAPDVARALGRGPLVEFPKWGDVYRKPTLFSTFANRVMTPRRDSYREYYEMLGFQSPPDPFEVLARTLGSKSPDRLQVLPVPRVSEDGVLSFSFLLHGGRHVDPDFEHLRQIREGDAVFLAPEATNAVSPVAVLVGSQPGTSRDTALGYVPDPLGAFVHALIAHSRDLGATAAHINVPEEGSVAFNDHLRLLVHVAAVVSPDFDPEAHLAPTG